ncbi:MAG: hypothetical protein HY690_14845 [Chloroflexi bacterium]|nr:hypothetical protein [Chloroflexota bacterium]
MSAPSWLWLALGLVAIIAAHELTHVAIARAYGHRLVCVAFNVIGVAVVFEDTPQPRYWLLQVALPALTTWCLSTAWLFGLFGFFGLSLALPLPPQPGSLLLVVTVLSVLTSGGDLAAFVIERRHPLWGDDRVLRDLRLLRKLPTLVLFTHHGRRWKPTWQQLGAPKPAAEMGG